MADCWILVGDTGSPAAMSGHVKTALENYGHTCTYKDIDDTLDTTKDIAISTPEITTTDMAKYEDNASQPYIVMGRYIQYSDMAGGAPVYTNSNKAVEADAETSTYWPSGGARYTKTTVLNTADTWYGRTAYLPGAHRHEICQGDTNTSANVVWAVDSGDNLQSGSAANSNQLAISMLGGDDSWTSDGETFLGELVDNVSGVPATAAATYVPQVMMVV